MSAVIFPKQTSAQEADVNFQVFYDELSPYGQWVDYKNYGYVWIPDAGADFVPYSTDGHWVLSDYGWTWVSDYEWGWAPFHYGRWDYDNYYGWLWMPDNQWGPAWVNWRQADGYYGWSPMEPGISLSIGFGRPYNRNDDHWMFVRDRDFERPDINRYYVNRTDHERIVRNSRVIRTTYVDNNRHTTYVTGPARADVQRNTGRQIRPVSIRENNRPGQQMNNGQLQMYRPQINKSNNRDRGVAPTRITNLKDVKRPTERTGANQQRNATPANNNERQQQPNVARPQNNDKAQPSQQQRNAAPTNNGRQQRPDAGKTQSTQPQQQQQQRTATPANNYARPQQQQQRQATQQQQQQGAQQRQAAQQQQQRQQQQGAQQQRQAAQQQQRQQEQGAQQQRQAAQQQQRQQQQGAQQQRQAAQQQQQQRQQQGAQQQQQRQQPQAAQQQQRAAQQQQQRQAQPAQQQRNANPANGGNARQQQPADSKPEKDNKRKE